MRNLLLFLYILQDLHSKFISHEGSGMFNVKSLQRESDPLKAIKHLQHYHNSIHRKHISLHNALPKDLQTRSSLNETDFLTQSLRTREYTFPRTILGNLKFHRIAY
jgi:hypothetical protein